LLKFPLKWISNLETSNRWCCLKDTYIIYLRKNHENLIGFVLLVDTEFEFKMRKKPGAYHALVIKNLSKSLVLKFKSSQSQQEWYDRILHITKTSAKCFYDDPTLSDVESFAPLRVNQMCKWYVNAAFYMEHVMHGLNEAKEEIFIADWWLCPELYLKRPSTDLQFRLDKILVKKASEGVKVYVLLFKEVDFLIGLVSEIKISFLN
jgi:phospholipase D1/2